jgi:Cu(I)/Ag(I) efflux system membrane fusion protein
LNMSTTVRRFWTILKTVQARLRFVAILAAIGLVIGNWTLLTAYWERWTRPSTDSAIAKGEEYYCPMHPQIIRDQPDKCPICGMPLSQRKKEANLAASNEIEALPPGVQRVQLSPYRVALAGLKTWEIKYQPLQKEIQTVGFVEFDERKMAQISAWASGKSRINKLFVNVTGQHVRKGEPLAELYNADLLSTAQNLLDFSKDKTLLKQNRDRLRLWGIADDEIDAMLASGQPLRSVTIRSPIHGHVRKKYVVEGQYVEEGTPLFEVVDLSTVWIEAQVYEDDMAFLRSARLSPPGRGVGGEGLAVTANVKAFPDRVFTGKVAFIQPHLDAATRTLKVRFDMKNPDHELLAGMYATVKIQVPVAQLELFANAQQDDWRNLSTLASMTSAFGAPSGLASPSALDAVLQTATRFALHDRGLVLAVPESSVIDTGTRRFVYREAWPGAYDAVEVKLGPRADSFYTVVRGLQAGDKVVTAGSFLVDAETRLTSGVASTYFGASGHSSHAEHTAAMSAASPSLSPGARFPEDAKIKVNLAKLSRADQRLAEAQGHCPILEDNRLGSMGVPVKVMIQDKPVFLCCQGCTAKAQAHQGHTLETVKRLIDSGRRGK